MGRTRTYKSLRMIRRDPDTNFIKSNSLRPFQNLSLISSVMPSTISAPPWIMLATPVAAASGKIVPREAYFPFAGDASKLDSAIKGRSKDVPQEIHPLLRSFQPYKGGNEILWTLNLLCIADKHKMITPIGTGIVRPGTNIRGTGFFDMPIPPVWDRSKQEVIFLTLGPEATFDYKFQFVLFIAFDEIGSVGGEPVRHILAQTIAEVEQTVAAIELEAKRLGLIA